MPDEDKKMLTYNFEKTEGPIYEYLYKCIKNDILTGVLAPGEKLPSKRTFAENNGISTITIQNAYDQLISEGYVYTLPKKGYYVAKIEGLKSSLTKGKIKYNIDIPKAENYESDLSGNSINADNFPFSIWNKLSREVMSNNQKELMTISPPSGVKELRKAIAEHLKSFRGMLIDPDQIIIGAGTEFLYGQIVQLLGNDKSYGIENPGYKKLATVYKQLHADCRFLSMDSEGVTLESLLGTKTEVAHICPNHHFPTGITMPASRRYEILGWANSGNGRYIIEDDYDSEFRLTGKPIPTLFSIDANEKVIYMNTFSKSLSPTIRISYMVLPVHLANLFYKKMGQNSCTVSNFEQYTLARFISKGYFEKHINRMRLYYARQRNKIKSVINESPIGSSSEIIESDSGLHFLIRINTDLSDKEVIEKLKRKGIKIKALSDYYFDESNEKQHLFIINYSNLDETAAKSALEKFGELLI